MYITVSDRCAAYQDREFQLVNKGNSYRLISDDPNDIALGFDPVEPGTNRFVKQGISFDELDLAYDKESFATYEGTVFEAMEIKDGMIMLRFPYNKKLLKRYGDRVKLFMDFYEMWVPLKEVTKITQVWKPLKTSTCQKVSHEK